MLANTGWVPTPLEGGRMSVRRIVGTVLILAVVALLFPSAVEATVRGELGDAPGGLGLMERWAQLQEWVQSVMAGLTQFVATEGASITSDG